MLNPDGHPLVAATLDTAMAGMAKVRARMVPEARGKVLEIGLGTGMNLPFYEDVELVVGIEPDPHMRRRAALRAAQVSVPVEIVDAFAEDLPFEADHFDTVVATWVLCTIPDPVAAAAEMRRVLKPEGTLLFAEHTVSEHAALVAIQTALNPLWRRAAGGCNLTRDAVQILRDAGFELDVRAPKRTWSTIVPTYRGTGR